jgi:predicted lipoprotein with Yx(FWY)xxD motif
VKSKVIQTGGLSVRRLLIIGVIGAAAIAVGVAIAAAHGGSATAKGGAVTVSAKQIGGMKVLVDSKGHALYRSEQEHGGMVLCTGACLSFWHPLLVTRVPKGGSLPGKLAFVKRPDGGRQVTYNGGLLYSFKLDKPGEVTGNGFKDAFGGHRFTWHVVRASGPATSGAAVNSGTTTTTPSSPYPSGY